MSLRWLFAAFLLALLAHAGCGQSITITSGGPAAAGGVNCVTISTPGGGGSSPPAVTVEVNGVPVSPSSVSLSQSGDGTWVVCFRVPAAAAGGSVTVTATFGGEHGSREIPVSGCSPVESEHL